MEKIKAFVRELLRGETDEELIARLKRELPSGYRIVKRYPKKPKADPAQEALPI